MLAESLGLVREWLAHADAHPVVAGASNGDQNPITVPHWMMDEFLSALPRGEWTVLEQLRRDPAAAGCVSREYPAVYLRYMIGALEVANGH